jgi:hypothetical protein
MNSKKTLENLPPLPEIKLPAPRESVGSDRPFMEATKNTEEKTEKKTEKKNDEQSPVNPVSSSEKEVQKYQSSTFVSFIEDAREALVGIPADAVSGRGSLYEILTKNNRLRGLGVLLIVLALFVGVFGVVGG